MERLFGRESGWEPEASFGEYFKGGTGAESVRALLRRVDLENEARRAQGHHRQLQGPASGACRQAAQGDLELPPQRQQAGVDGPRRRAGDPA